MTGNAKSLVSVIAVLLGMGSCFTVEAGWLDAATGQPVKTIPLCQGTLDPLTGKTDPACNVNSDPNHAVYGSKNLYWDASCGTWRDSSTGNEVRTIPLCQGTLDPLTGKTDPACNVNSDPNHAVYGSKNLFWSPCGALTTSQQCTPSLNSQGTGYSGFDMHVPVAVPLSSSLAPGNAATNYWGDFTATPKADGTLSVTLVAYGPTTLVPPFSCQVPTLTIVGSGAYSLFTPQILSSGNIAYSASLMQQVGTTVFNVPSSGAPLPQSMQPSGAIRCSGVTHYSGYSVINVCANLNNVDAGAVASFTSTITGGSTTDKGGTASFSADQRQLTGVCQLQQINTYGPYAGQLGVTTQGGNLMLPWNLNVTSTPQACQ